MSAFTLGWVASALGVDPRGPSGLAAGGFSIDTRTMRPGEAFVAIAGDRFDGHAFVPQAVDAGASLVVVERGVDVGVPVLRVGSTRGALQRLASAHRDRLRGTVVGVTGSNGKTTTVRLIDSVLRAGGLAGGASVKSYNNAIGVPLTVLGAGVGDDYLVSEMGTSGPGEIGLLADIGRPRVAVITSIGRAHLEQLGSVRGIAREKAQIAGHAEVVVVNGESPYVLDELPVGPEVVTCGRTDACVVRLDDVRASERGVRFRVDGAPFEIGLEGTHNAMNAAAAVVVGRRLGLGDDAIRAGLLAAQAAAMRWERGVVELDGGAVEVINDAYNANPDSVIAGLEALGGRCDGRRVLVVGEMLELGAQRDALHAEVGRAIADRAAAGGGPELLVVVGDGAGALFEAVGRVVPEAVRLGSGFAPSEVASLIRPGDRVVLKGSRGIGLERVLGALSSRSAQAPGADGR